MTFNDIDNSHKMVCCGDNRSIPDFLEGIKEKGALKGVVIENITSEEIPFRIYLPAKFVRLYTDELSDISRKPDVGVDILQKIKNDTSSLPHIKDILDSFVIEQKEHNMRMDEHNKRLEKILIKLAEK